MTISTDAEKAFDKIPQPLMTESLKKIGLEGPCFSLIKLFLTNLLPTSCYMGRKPKAFPPKSGIRLGGLLSPLLFNMLLAITVPLVGS